MDLTRLCIPVSGGISSVSNPAYASYPGSAHGASARDRGPETSNVALQLQWATLGRDKSSHPKLLIIISRDGAHAISQR